MTGSRRNPGCALQRAAGAGKEIETDHNFQHNAYATCTELQSRHVMRRCGVGRRHATVIAGLFFEEER